MPMVEEEEEGKFKKKKWKNKCSVVVGKVKARFMAVQCNWPPNHHKPIMHDQDLIGSIICRAQNITNMCLEQ